MSECHKTAYEAHGYDVISMSKKESFCTESGNLFHILNCTKHSEILERKGGAHIFLGVSLLLEILNAPVSENVAVWCLNSLEELMKLWKQKPNGEFPCLSPHFSASKIRIPEPIRMQPNSMLTYFYQSEI